MEDFDKLSKKELIDLLNKKNQETQSIAGLTSSESELDKIDRLATRSNPNQIPYREMNDHKNIMLYTAINKRVGPLHPDNARTTMIRWRKAGIALYTTPRTPQQVEEFKNSDEYKRHLAKHQATRKQRRAQSSKGKVEAMVKEVAAAAAAAAAVATARPANG